eukprot:10745787-Ditylum_brightwellii.AAC.1
MREVIPLVNLLNEIKESIRILQDSDVEFKCTVFEDNNGYVLELAKCTRVRPRIKDIGIKYHHFRKKVKEGLIKVIKIDKKDQQADILIKT